MLLATVRAAAALFSFDQILSELGREHDFGLEECAGDAGRDGDERPLIREDFDLTSTGDVGEVDGTSAADEGDGGGIGSDGGERGEEFAGVDEEGFLICYGRN